MYLFSPFGGLCVLFGNFFQYWKNICVLFGKCFQYLFLYISKMVSSVNILSLSSLNVIFRNTPERPSRWWRSETWRSPSSPQIHQKYIYMWNSSYRTPTERWQKTSDFPKGKKLPTYLGRAKEKRKNRDIRIGTGPAPVGGSCEGGKVSTH